MSGSSPRMRGALIVVDDHLVIPGIIPADAGSTLTDRAAQVIDKDHPRGCGEHKLTRALVNSGRGSSPRMRGALSFGCAGQVRPGIIPADAGSTRSSAGTGRPGEDHPRGCGEHWSGWYIVLSVQGSSPRMRGALCAKISAVKCIGIIPADAGSTLMIAGRMLFKEDHPRGCGEHAFPSESVSSSLGSSPRMRGARRWMYSSSVRLRIIPADAGSTFGC